MDVYCLFSYYIATSTQTLVVMPLIVYLYGFVLYAILFLFMLVHCLAHAYKMMSTISSILVVGHD